MNPPIVFAVFAVVSWVNWGFNVDDVSEFWAGVWWATNCGLTLYAVVWLAVALKERR